LLINPLDRTYFTANFTDSFFSFTGIHYQKAVSNTTGCFAAETGSGFIVQFTADDIQLVGARICGDGNINTQAEECDEGPANGRAGSCCTADCKLRAAGSVCRPQATTCDAAERCDGQSGACPPDIFAPDDTSCEDGVFCNGVDSCVAGRCSRH